MSSGIDIHNLSCISFAISIFKNGAFNEIGICPGEHSQRRSVALKQSASALDGKVSKASSRFGIPVDLVRGFRSDFAKNDDATMTIFLSPEVECRHEGWHLSGGTKLRINGADLLKATSGQTLFEVTCRPLCIQYPDAIPPPDIYALVIQAQLTMTLIDGKHPSIDFCIKPRSFIINKMPISLTIQTPMPRVFSRKSGDWKHVEDVCHSIEPNQQIEIFTPGPSIAILLKCSDSPVGGTATDWVDGGWIDLPLLSDFRLQEPLQCIFPFVKKSTDSVRSGSARGVDFSIVQGGNGLAGLSSGQDGDGVASKLKVSGNDAVEVLSPPPNDEDWPIFFVTVRNYAVDHIGDILFEQVGISAGLNSTPDTNVGASLVQQVSPSIGAYGTGRHCGRVSLLPQSHIQIRLLHLSMEGDEGLRRSAPFRIDDISLGEGGVDSTQVKWMDGTVSGFSAYRRLVHPYQSEIHLIPEFIVFNGSETHKVIVKQTGGTEQGIDPGKFVPLRSNDPSSVIVTIAYPELGVMSRPVRIDSLGSRVALVKSTDGFPLGSVAIQTVVGARDSRFVVKLGSITFGSSRAPAMDSSLSNLLRDDFLRFRIMWSELEVTLTEARPLQGKNQAILESALDQIQKTVTPVKIDDSSAKTETWVEAREKYRLDRQVEFRPDIDTSVCTVIFGRFTVDWQRVFKEDEATQWKFSAESREPKERSQFSVVVHHVRIRDETPDSPYPIVFDSTSQKVPFLGLVIRSRGRSNLDLVTIDLLELNLAYDDGISEKIYLNTNEDFVWKALDLADRILAAAAEFAGVDIELNWDEEHDGYVVAIREKASTFLEEETIYEPPKSDTVYHIKKSRVSPFTCVISFKRNPQSSRYKTFRDMAGANIMNYFTRKLKFKIDKAELYFSRYELTDVKGPPNLIVDMMFAYYLSRIKAKILTIVTSSSFQDWKLLSMRESGDDAYAEGDIVRATGNVAGTTANFLFKQAGLSISSGVRNAANSLGDGIESATGAIGVRSLGAGVNSVVSGVGDGVGDTISGGKFSAICLAYTIYYLVSLYCYLKKWALGQGKC